ncbi:MAG: anti-sigma factor [Nitrospira sp.]|nr:anti-sigma factor [Nitrospira sp.]
MTHEELEETIPLYAVGALERGERQATDAHLLSGCVSCHTALKEYQSAAAILPFGLMITPPPRKLKAKIMGARTSPPDQDTVKEPSGKQSLGPGEWMNHLIPPETSPPTYTFRWIVGLAMAAAVVGAGYQGWTSYHTQMSEDTTRLEQLQNQAATADSQVTALRRQVNERDKSLNTTREELNRRLSDIAELKDQLIQREAELEVATAHLTQQGGQPIRTTQDELAALLRSPHANATALSGTETASRASGLFLYDTHTQKAWLYTLKLPECPNGMTYQVWATHEQPISIGTFRVRAGETSHLFVTSIPDFLSANTFSVSLEPIGGQTYPTGPVYLFSQS